MNVRHILITGGVRSGKSRFAEEQAMSLGGRVFYLATAEARDDEMRHRIKEHQRRRPPSWETVEVPLALADAIGLYHAGDTVLVDCLTLYLTNLYFAYEPNRTREEITQKIIREIDGLTIVIRQSEASLILVTNEVGWGIVPETPLGRIFRDLSGMVNQRVAAACKEVFLMVCGIPMVVKGVSHDS